MTADRQDRIDYHRMRRTARRRNYGCGKQITYAAYIVLLWLYGYGHYLTRHVHHIRFCQFASFLKKQFHLQDARVITTAHLHAYAEYLSALVQNGEMRVSYAQNLISSVNVVIGGFRQDNLIWISPSKTVGRRSQIRTTLPGGAWPDVYDAVERLEQCGNFRGAAIVLLARAFGMRYREAVLAELTRLQREATKYGYCTVLDGTKGGRKCMDRRILVATHQQNALNYALQARPKGSNNLLHPTETFKAFLDKHAHNARPILKSVGIRCFHDLRAAYLIERYESISQQAVPVKGLPVDPARDKVARAQIAIEAGHGEHRTSNAYIGRKTKS